MKLKILDLIIIMLLFLVYGSFTTHLQYRQQKEMRDFNRKYSENHLEYNINSRTCLNFYVRGVPQKCLEDKDENIKLF
jgi:uncharacterized membrane protein